MKKLLLEDYMRCTKNFSKGDSVSYRRIFDFINELELLGLISTKTVSRGREKDEPISLICNVMSNY